MWRKCGGGFEASPLVQAECQRHAAEPGPLIRGTFLPTRAWRPAVFARLAGTLRIRETFFLSHTIMNSTSTLVVTIIGLSLAACAGTKVGEVGAPQPVEKTNLPFSSRP